MLDTSKIVIWIGTFSFDLIWPKYIEKGKYPIHAYSNPNYPLVNMAGWNVFHLVPCFHHVDAKFENTDLFIPV
jgi:hypothetical protein